MGNWVAMIMTQTVRCNRQRICQARFCLGLFIGLPLLTSGAELKSIGAINEDKNLRILERKNGGEVTTLFAYLTNCTEATVTLTMTLVNASASRQLPLVIDSKGRRSFELVTVRRSDPQRAWNYRYQYCWRPGRRGTVATNSFAYRLPYVSGAYTVVQADFGSFSHQQGSGDEHAIDWEMPVGTRICAAREGTVVAIRQDSDVGGEDRKYKHAPNYVVLRHDDGTFAEYCHLTKNGVIASLGQKVKTGQPLGFSGDTGFQSRPHLHFAVFQTVDGQIRRTVPVRFKTQTGEVEFLKEGLTYR